MSPNWNVTDLRCEYKRNPLGIGEREPRLSWKLKSSERGARQTAYQVQVSTDNDFQSALTWDTGKTASDQSVHIPYEGDLVQPRTRYYYRVKAWNAHDEASDWSETAYWETGIDRSEWTAQWITAKLPTADGTLEPCHQLRTAFSLKGPVVSARLYATALGLYRVYVNGQPADDTLFAPGWTSYKHRLQVQTYDVTNLLSEGANAIGIMLGNGWFKGNLGWVDERNLYGENRAALAQLHVRYADGSEDVLGTDDAWKASAGPLLMSEIYHGETYDARRETAGWLGAGYDDAGWAPVDILDYTKAILVAQENDPTRAIQEIRPVSRFTTPAGDLVLDMGQNMVGWVRFTVDVPAGTTVQLNHAEVLDKEGNFYIGNLRKAKQTITYISRGDGPATYEPYFSFQGFRYVRVIGVPAEQLDGNFVGVVIHTDMEPTSRFRTSNELLNKLQSNIVWGQKGNFLDIPTDCPQRDERLGWTGDAQVFVRTAAFNMNVAPFFTKWLKDLAAEQLPDGGVPFVIPHVLKPDSHSSAAWGDAAVICPWTIYECYGDTRILENQYESMQKWIGYMRSQGDNEYLWNTGFHFGDWVALDAKEGSYIGATPRDLIATAFYAYSTQLLAKTARVLNKAEDAAGYEELYERIVEAFRREFVTPNGRVASPTQTAYALALAFDLLEERHRPRAASILAEYIRENKGRLTTGFVGTPYLCHALSRYGYTEQAYGLVLQQEYPSWLYSVLQGATTIWEHWDGIKPDGTFWSDDMNSFNHYAYGSIGDWLYQVAAGIETDPERPGYKKIRIAPTLTSSLTLVEAAHDSMYGEIASGWETLPDGRIVVAVTIPANTEAVVTLPGASGTGAGVRESGAALGEAPGIRSVQPSAAGLQIELGSGTYRFEYATA